MTTEQLVYKWNVLVESKPGLSHPFKAMYVITAPTKGIAEGKAVAKARAKNPKFKYRNRSMWIAKAEEIK